MIARKRSAPGLRITGAYSTLRLAGSVSLARYCATAIGLLYFGSNQRPTGPRSGRGDPRERGVVFKPGAVSSFSWGSSIAPGDNGDSESPEGFELMTAAKDLPKLYGICWLTGPDGAKGLTVGSSVWRGCCIPTTHGVRSSRRFGRRRRAKR